MMLLFLGEKTVAEIAIFENSSPKSGISHTNVVKRWKKLVDNLRTPSQEIRKSLDQLILKRENYLLNEFFHTCQQKISVSQKKCFNTKSFDFQYFGLKIYIFSNELLIQM